MTPKTARRKVSHFDRAVTRQNLLFFLSNHPVSNFELGRLVYHTLTANFKVHETIPEIITENPTRDFSRIGLANS